MSRWSFIVGAGNRDLLKRWIDRAPVGFRVEFKEPQRSTEQNARFWAMLTDVSQQATHNGRKFTTDQWKALFLHACGREVQFIPALEGGGFIPWGQSSSDLSKAEMSEVMEFIAAWGAQNGITFQNSETEAA